RSKARVGDEAEILCPTRAVPVFDPQPAKAPSKSRSAVGLPQCYLPLRSTGETAGETARVHHAAQRRCDGVARRGARAAIQVSANWRALYRPARRAILQKGVPGRNA